MHVLIIPAADTATAAATAAAAAVALIVRGWWLDVTAQFAADGALSRRVTPYQRLYTTYNPTFSPPWFALYLHVHYCVLHMRPLLSKLQQPASQVLIYVCPAVKYLHSCHLTLFLNCLPRVLQLTFIFALHRDCNQMFPFSCDIVIFLYNS